MAKGRCPPLRTQHQKAARPCGPILGAVFLRLAGNEKNISDDREVLLKEPNPGALNLPQRCIAVTKDPLSALEPDLWYSRVP